jgi:hypothetical protein
MDSYPRFEFEAVQSGKYLAHDDVIYLEFNATTKRLKIITEDRLTTQTTTLNLSEIEEFEFSLSKSY